MLFSNSVSCESARGYCAVHKCIVPPRKRHQGWLQSTFAYVECVVITRLAPQNGAELSVLSGRPYLYVSQGKLCR